MIVHYRVIDNDREKMSFGTAFITTRDGGAYRCLEDNGFPRSLKASDFKNLKSKGVQVLSAEEFEFAQERFHTSDVDVENDNILDYATSVSYRNISDKFSAMRFLGLKSEVSNKEPQWRAQVEKRRRLKIKIAKMSRFLDPSLSDDLDKSIYKTLRRLYKTQDRLVVELEKEIDSEFSTTEATLRNKMTAGNVQENSLGKDTRVDSDASNASSQQASTSS